MRSADHSRLSLPENQPLTINFVGGFLFVQAIYKHVRPFPQGQVLINNRIEINSCGHIPPAGPPGQVRKPAGSCYLTNNRLHPDNFLIAGCGGGHPRRWPGPGRAVRIESGGQCGGCMNFDRAKGDLTAFVVWGVSLSPFN